jgi:cyclic-di-GMP-binding protein
MKFNIPEQTAPAADATPSHPRKLKKVLSALPNSNMGELTKQTFMILRELNRQTMPNKQRLEDLEMIRVLARNIFNNLKKYFINRTLPLPDKSQKIVNLNQSILQELVYGYEIIIFEAANNIDTKIDDKTLSIAACRAMNYLSEMLLRSSEVYSPCPRNLWYDAHQLYVFAESRSLTDIVVIDDEKNPEKLTIENSYKQILLFSLARPIALRQRDSERVYKELFEWSKYSEIQREASENQIDHVFRVRVHEDSAPNYLTKADLAEDITIRTLDASKLVSHVKGLIEEQRAKKQGLTVGDDISIETLNTLVYSWGVSAKRRFSRAHRQGHINVSIGLTRTAKAIRDSLRRDDETLNIKSGFLRTSASTKQDPDFTLQRISLPDDDSGYMTHTELGADVNNSWDMVAKGRALTDTYDKEQKFANEDKVKLRQQNADSHWDVVNISAGGYCLRWNSDDTSKAQIGELIALQEFDTKDNFEWRVGVIRWMQFTHEHGLEIGVQVISPKVVAATAQRVNRPNELPFDCLLLPGIKALKQASSIILPSHAFKTNDKLTVKVLDNKINITLGETKEHTGSFTQFTYKSTEVDQRIKKQVKKEEATKNKDDFDELWSSL